MKCSLFGIMTLLLVASLVLAACGATPVPTEAPQPTEEAQAPEPTEAPQGEEAEPVTVDVWFHSGRAAEREALLASFGAEFEAANPDIEIELVELPEGGYNDQVQAAAIAGELPCVLDFDGPFVYNYVWGEYLIPLDDYFSQEELDDFLPSIIDQGTYQDGKLYSLGQYDSGLAIWAHKSYLEEAGVRIPTVDDPWDRAEYRPGYSGLVQQTN